METEKIISIRRVKTEPVYNISVLTDESYTANGIVVHNCRSGLVPLTEDEYQPDMEFENRDFSGVLGDPKKVDKAFQNIDKFNDKYRVSKFTLDQDLGARIMFDKGFSVGISGPDLSGLVQNVSGKVEFVPAKTVKEAEQRLKDKGITYVDMKGVPIEHANAFLEVVDNIPKDAIPDAFGNGSAFAKFTTTPLKRKAGSWYGVSIKYPSITVDGITKVEKTYQIVAINTKDYKTLQSIVDKKKAFNESWLKKTGNKYFFNDETGISTHYHECGHIFDNQWYISSSREWEDLSKKWLSEMDIKYDILAKPSEAWAEAFADVYGNGGNRVPDYINDYVKEKTSKEIPEHLKKLVNR